MPTLDQIDLFIREYHIINILLFIMGWMTYDLIKLSKSNKPSAEQLNMVKANIQKAKQLHEKRKFEYMSIDNLKKDNNSLLKTIRSKNIVIDLKNQSINTLKCENEYLKEKIDNLVKELMKRQSYDNVEKSETTRTSYSQFLKFENNLEPDVEI